jgi:hypothetical protein
LTTSATLAPAVSKNPTSCLKVAFRYLARIFDAWRSAVLSAHAASAKHATKLLHTPRTQFAIKSFLYTHITMTRRWKWDAPKKLQTKAPQAM